MGYGSGERKEAESGKREEKENRNEVSIEGKLAAELMIFYFKSFSLSSNAGLSILSI